MVKHARQEGVDREVATANPVVEATIKREEVSLVPKWLQQRRFFVFPAGGLGEKLISLESEQVPDRDKSPRPYAGTFCGENG